MFAKVIVQLKVKSIDHTFTYKIPNNLLNIVKKGSKVIVPFGKQLLEGFVLEITDKYEDDFEIKDIAKCPYDTPSLNDELLLIGKYISNKTLSTLIKSYQVMLPTGVKANINKKITKKEILYISLNIEKNIKLSESSIKIINLLKEKKEVKKSDLNKISVSSVNTLLKKNIIKEVKKEEYREVFIDKINSKKITLSLKQSNIVNEVINQNEFIPYLLHGITGSGKTEVYMEIIENILKQNKKALVLVPEISLTPQFISKFTNRFNENIAVLHSKLSIGEKFDQWRKIEDGNINIVIGARSAVFAPLSNIGIIILDEEHSDSYKQDKEPRYSAIDIALFRGKYHKCPVILGSATPSIQSYTRAKIGEYKLLSLDERVNSSLPSVYLVDMKDELKKGNFTFSELLINKINDRLYKNEQIMILLNKRGYSRISKCNECGFVDKCPKCDIPLTYHKSTNTVKCHYCNYTKSIMKVCKECKNDNIKNSGMGTEKLVEELLNVFKDVKIIRMDADTTSKKNSINKIVSDFNEKKYDILVGTQMIAKGLDFDNVTLVGVISADSSLNIPDYKSGEKTHELLSQVAGRAGRSNLSGEVVFQGFNMDHYSITTASIHNFNKFYEKEMEIRKVLKYPPYYNLTTIELSSKYLNLLEKECDKIRCFLEKDKDFILLGPTPSLMPKKNDVYYYTIIMKYKKSDLLIKKLKYLNNKYKDNLKVNLQVDFN